MCSHYFSFYSIVTSKCVVEIEKRKSNFTPWSSFFSIFANVTVAECNVFTLFLFYSIVTPKCDVEIEKKKSNVNTFTLLFHLFFVYFYSSSGKCNVFTLLFFLFYYNISVCCWNRRALLNSFIWGFFCPSPAEAELVILSAYPATHRPTLFKPYP